MSGGTVLNALDVLPSGVELKGGLPYVGILNATSINSSMSLVTIEVSPGAIKVLDVGSLPLLFIGIENSLPPKVEQLSILGAWR
jgi:hypothetical protein